MAKVSERLRATDPQVRPRKGLSLKLVFILSIVVLLVTLPVLPLRSLGIPGPDWVTSSPYVPAVGRWLGRFIPHKPEEKTKSGPGSTKTARGIDRYSSLAEAAAALRVEISKSPENPGLQNRIGLVYMALGDLDAAEIHFKKAVQLSRTGLENVEIKQKHLMSEGKRNESSLAFIDTARLNNELSAAHSNLARLYERWGQHEKVIAQLESLNREGLMGVVKTKTGRKNQIAGRLPGKRSPVVEKHLAYGQALINQGRFQEAQAIFEKTIAIDPEESLAHHQLGLIHSMTGSHEQAVESLEKAAQLSPGDARAHNNLGLCYEAVGQPQKAVSEYRKSLALEPKLVEASINLGNLHAARGEFVAARQVLKDAVKLRPDSAVAANNLGTVYSMNEEYGQAVKEFRRALKLNPSMASAHYGLGLAYFQLQNYRMSIQELRTAVNLDPSLSAAHDRISQATRKMGMGHGGAMGLN